MTYANTDPTSLLADRRWRTRHSAWLLAVILGVGLLSFIGYVYIALRVRTKKLWIAMVVACTASAVTWIVSSDTDPATAGEQVSDLAAGVTAAVWFGLIVYGVIINRDYLRWRATRTEASSWYNQPISTGQAASSLAPVPAPAAPVHPAVAQPAATPSEQKGSGVLGIDANQYFAQANPPVPTHPTPSPVTRLTPTPASSMSGPVDVNTASAAEIATAVRGDAALAERIVTARGRRGGFRDLDDLVAGAGVQPHEFMKLRGKVTFGPFSVAPTPEPAQEPEQQSPPTPTQPGGRILDF